MPRIAALRTRGAETGSGERRGQALRIAVVIFVATMAVWSSFAAADWYARRVSLPRFCDDPEAAAQRVRAIVTDSVSATDRAERRPYVIAAKLLFLVPSKDGEPAEAYAARLRRHIEKSCR